MGFLGEQVSHIWSGGLAVIIGLVASLGFKYGYANSRALFQTFIDVFISKATVMENLSSNKLGIFCTIPVT